tara:strand:- start:89 stop:358 length:270 start_codon:yes stop_codon:yes gene_type:complete
MTWKQNMTKIVETLSGTMTNPDRIAMGSASQIRKEGPFYNFSIRIDVDDIREYSFTDRDRAETMRQVLIGHLKEKLKTTQNSLHKKPFR